MLIRLLLALLLVSAQGVGALHALEHVPGQVAEHGTDDADAAPTLEERCAACEALCSAAPPPATHPLQTLDTPHDRHMPMRGGPSPAARHDGPGTARGPPTHA